MGQALRSHRGGIALALGLLCVLLPLTSFFVLDRLPVGSFTRLGFLIVPLGVAAFVLGTAQLVGGRARVITQAGRVAARLGQVLGGLGTLGWTCLVATMPAQDSLSWPESLPAISVPFAVDTARAREELDIFEAVYRYQFEHNASGDDELKRAEYIFLSLGKDGDPPPELLNRFAEHLPPVEPLSAADLNSVSGVRHARTRRPGIIFRVDGIRWIDENSVDVQGGYYEAGLSASGNTYRVERKAGGWQVVQDRMNWIS